MTGTPLVLLAKHAARAPSAPCVVHLESRTTVSYGQAWDAARRLTGLLADLGVGRRDRVVFAIRNHWLIFPILAACCARRAVLVPVDPDLHRDELAFILGDAAPVLIITGEAGLGPAASGRGVCVPLSRLLAAVGDDRLSPASGAADPASDAADPASDAADPALMIYTSGTTGGSKCVVLTSANLLANAASLVSRYEVTAEDRFFCTLPTHHMNALMMTGMVPLTAGAAIVLADVLSFKNAKLYWRLVAEHGVTICSLVPSIMSLMLQLFPEGPRPAVPRLRLGFCGAAPLPADVWRRFEGAFGVPVYQGYGLTETTCWAVSSALERGEGPQRWDNVGVPLTGCEVRIDNTRVGDVETLLFETGERAARDAIEGYPSGEVLIRGPIVGPGYYKNPRLTAECTTRDGFFRTGDLGYFDGEGCLHISGRLKDVIIRNGANIFSREVDRVLGQHASVKECKTVGLRDELVGERVHSVCVLEEGHEVPVSTLRKWAQEHLSPHMWPDAVVRMGYLPAGAAGKVSTGTLRKILSGELAAELVGALNSWRYKRAQPSDLEAVGAVVQRALLQGGPISFLAYWGCGTRDTLSACDHDALLRLRDYIDGVRRIPQVPPTLTLVLTDLHARNNRIPESRQAHYFGAIREHAVPLGFETVWLSDLWARGGLSVDEIEQALAEPEFDASWTAEALRARLVEQATKHVEQSRDPETAARFYYASCRREGALLAELYPSHLFTTYNHPDFDCLSPNLPRLYLYSYKEGTSVKPWFVDA